MKQSRWISIRINLYKFLIKLVNNIKNYIYIIICTLNPSFINESPPTTVVRLALVLFIVIIIYFGFNHFGLFGFYLLGVSLYYSFDFQSKNLFHKLYRNSKNKYPNRLIQTIMLIKKKKIYFWCTVVLAITGCTYIKGNKFIDKMFYSSVFPIFILLTSFFVFNEKLMLYRIQKGHYGTNEFEARQMISFIINETKNEEKRITKKITLRNCFKDCFKDIKKEVQSITDHK